AGETVDVEYELVPLPQLFARYSIDLDLPLDPRDAGLEPVARADLMASRSNPGRQGPTRVLADELRAEKEAKFEKGPLTCKASAAAKFKSTEFDIKATTNLTLQVEGRKEVAEASTPEHTKVVLSGPIALDVFGGLRAEAGFEGKAECELKKHIPIPLGGVLAVVLAITVPIGLTAGAEGSVKAVDLELGPKGHLGTNVTVGFECNSAACWAIKEQTPDANNGINFESKVNLLRDMRVEANVALNVVTGLGLKVGTGEYSLIDAKIGPVQALNLGFEDSQARDGGYASAYDLKVAGSVTPGEDLKSAISRVFGGEVTLDLAAKYESKPLAESPKGQLSVEKSQVQLGKPVGLYVDVDPKTMDYFLIGPNVVEIRVFRWKDDRLTPVATMPVSASGQTRFEYLWTPSRDFLGMNELVAFVTTRGLPAVPLEIAPNSSAYVEVLEACLGNPPTNAPPPAPGASPVVVPPAPSQPQENPCDAMGTITFDHVRTSGSDQHDIVFETTTHATLDLRLVPDPEDPETYLDDGSTWTLDWSQIGVDTRNDCVVRTRNVFNGSGTFSETVNFDEVGATLTAVLLPDFDQLWVDAIFSLEATNVENSCGGSTGFTSPVLFNADCGSSGVALTGHVQETQDGAMTVDFTCTEGIGVVAPNGYTESITVSGTVTLAGP
ncbi:MAG TPA: hypothetical protein VMZ66_10255, partial [Aeromicrobium sp.]|nr:hypothetical protein [Aeromicrobium sp.]